MNNARVTKKIGDGDHASREWTWVHQNVCLSAPHGVARECAGRGDRVTVCNHLWVSDKRCMTTACRLVEDTLDHTAATVCRWRVRRGSMLADDRPQNTQTAVH